MADILSFPFRLAPNGSAATVYQGSDQYYSEQIATIILTLQNERDYDLEFGMPDIAFDGFPYSNFQHQIQQYLPDLDHVTATVVAITEDTQTINVVFNSEG